jgi:hypothetical protein
LRDVIAGTKTAEEAFADFLTTVADQLVQTAATMIAQYIAIGIAKSFAGLGTDPGGSSINSFGGGNPLGALAGSMPFTGFADGGRPSTGQVSIVGERGPELFVPDTAGTVVPNNAFNAARQSMTSSRSVQASTAATEREQEQLEVMQNSSALDVRFETYSIGGMDVVTRDEAMKISEQSAKRARAQVFADMRNRPSTRAKLGIS